MATVTVSKDLDVLNKYSVLLAESLGSNSVYIRAKETIEQLVAEGDLDNASKAKIIAEVVGSLNSSLVNASMGTAMQWANAEKDVELKKLELAKQLDILDSEVLLKQAQIDKMKADDIAQQAQTIRQFGTPVVIGGVVTQLTNDGKVAKEIELLEQQRLNAIQENTLVQAKQRESYAAVHKLVADTVVNYGAWNYAASSLSANGMLSAPTQYKPAGMNTLSEIQAEIAKEQAKGYAYNAWSNAVVGASSMVGTAITTELDIFQPGGTGAELVTIIKNVATKLNNVPAVTF